MRTALLFDAVTLLEERGARPALIGAMALAVHGIGRSTQDVDFLVLDRSVLGADVWKGLSASGAAVEIRRGDGDDPLAGVVRLSRPGEAAVDVIVGKEEWHSQVLDRRFEVLLEGQRLFAARAADLVLLKLDAGGPQDLLDIRLLLQGGRGTALRAEVKGLLRDLPQSLRSAWAANFGESGS